MGRWAECVTAAGAEAGRLIGLGAHGRDDIVIISGADRRARALVDLAQALPVGRVTLITVTSAAVRRRTGAVPPIRMGGTPTVEALDLPAPQFDGLHWEPAVREAGRLLAGVDAHAHVVVDVDSLPPVSACLLVGGLLQREKSGSFRGQLQVIAGAGRPATRAGISVARPRSDADLDQERQRGPKRRPATTPQRNTRMLWVPVLTEGCEPELRQVLRRLDPDDICPVLPFPSRNPRRGDDLVLEYHALLSPHLDIVTRTFLYCREGDPLDLYRTLDATQRRYRTAATADLTPVVVVSPGPDVLTLLGALLASHEFDLELAVAAQAGTSGDFDSRPDTDGDPTCYWLAGDPYRESGHSRRSLPPVRA